MHLYAKDSNGSLVFAEHGFKQKDYFCLECQGLVRLRQGMHRQSHFYHLESQRSCHLNAKSMTHIQIQCYFQKLFSPKECILEHRFQQINRIADVVWLPHQLIFEIQCSSITAQEVQERNRDYQSIGYQVIWILHEKRFNQWRLSAAESYLKKFPHYYTNMDAQGQGMIYDQFSLVVQGVKKSYLPPLPIEVTRPVFQKEGKTFEKLPNFIQERMNHWPLFFVGDLISCYFEEKNQFLTTEYGLAIAKLESTISAEKESFSLKNFCIKMYQLVFNFFLERACR